MSNITVIGEKRSTNVYDYVKTHKVATGFPLPDKRNKKEIKIISLQMSDRLTRIYWLINGHRLW